MGFIILFARIPLCLLSVSSPTNDHEIIRSALSDVQMNQNTTPNAPQLEDQRGKHKVNHKLICSLTYRELKAIHHTTEVSMPL